MFTNGRLLYGNLNKKRIVGYDYLRVFSAFMVVFIHTAANFTCGSSIGSLIRNQLLTICNIAVPLFFMISGALLLEVEEPVSLKTLFKKRILNIFIPFLLWSIAYTAMRIVSGSEKLSLSAFTSIWHEPAYYQFWFIYTLLAIYLLLPVLQMIALRAEKSQFTYIILLWFITNAVIYQLRYLGSAWAVSEHFNLVFLQGYLGYFLLGFYIKKFVDYKQSYYLYISAAGFIAGIIVSYFSWRHGHYWNEYVSLPSVLFSFGIFGLIKQKENILHKENKFTKVIIKMSELTFGIYLVHLFPVTALKYAGLMDMDSIFVMLASTLISFVLSLFICFIISLIKPFRKALLGL